MLNEADLQAIKSIVQENGESLKRNMKEELGKSENLVLGEIERIQTNLDAKIERITRNLDELKQYYRITKLETDNSTLLLQLITDLRKEVEELKKRTA